MSLQVLIAQSDPKSVQFLVDAFSEWGDQVFQTTEPAQFHTLLTRYEPDLVVLDIHMLNDMWKNILADLRDKSPDTKILFTAKYPNSQAEFTARQEYGARVILRQPFTRLGLEQTLRDLEGDRPVLVDPQFKASLPKVKFPIQAKIALPYAILALLLAVAAAYLMSRIVLDTIEERFTNQLIEAAKLTSDWMVNEEDRMLETLRLISYTQGLPEAIASADAERLRELALPVAVNYQEEAIEILNAQGVSLLSMHHRAGSPLEDYDISKGENRFSQWVFVKSVLEQKVEFGRDKYAGLAQAPWGDYLYIAGPILDNNGRLIGAVLIGKSLPSLVRQIRETTLAHITIYDFNGRKIASTFPTFTQEVDPLNQTLISTTLERQNEMSAIRPLTLASINYSELIGPWEVREFLTPQTVRTRSELGIIGVAMAETFLARPGQITRLQIFVLTIIAFLLVIMLGIFLARRITRPLLRVVDVSAQVAQGNLNVQVESKGNDEVAVLAHSFNQMISGLQEGFIYRDLFGRTVSPEVREQLRQSFASGEINLEGQEAEASVLVSDIRGFTTLSETERPTTILDWLNEFFAELIPIITSQGGVISKFDGDAVLAFFGILPRPISAQESAYRACQTALAMLDAVERLNARREQRGDPAFSMGIGINTGPVTAGGLGSVDRLHYTIIGDTVNTTARLESLTRQFGQENVAVISQHTLFALRERRHDFNLESMGAHTVKGKEEQLLVYLLKPTKTTN